MPPTARLHLQKLEEATVQPFELIPVVNYSRTDMRVLGFSRGLIFMTALFVKSQSECLLEGCFHLLSNGAAFPGVTLSTGGGDHYDSSFYFAACGGESPGANFHLATTGITHLNTTVEDGVGGTSAVPTQFSAYRIHKLDPLLFENEVSQCD